MLYASYRCLCRCSLRSKEQRQEVERARAYSPVFFPLYFLRFNVIIYRHRQRKTETGRCKFCSSHLPFSRLIFVVVEKNASRGLIIRKWMLQLFFFCLFACSFFVICRCTTQTTLTDDCINILLPFYFGLVSISRSFKLNFMKIERERERKKNKNYCDFVWDFTFGFVS